MELHVGLMPEDQGIPKIQSGIPQQRLTQGRAKVGPYFRKFSGPGVLLAIKTDLVFTACLASIKCVWKHKNANEWLQIKGAWRMIMAANQRHLPRRGWKVGWKEEKCRGGTEETQKMSPSYPSISVVTEKILGPKAHSLASSQRRKTL